MKRKIELPEIPELRRKYSGKERDRASIRFPVELRNDLEEMAEKQGYGYNFTEILIALSDYWLEQEKVKGK